MRPQGEIYLYVRKRYNELKQDQRSDNEISKILGISERTLRIPQFSIKN